MKPISPTCNGLSCLSSSISPARKPPSPGWKICCSRAMPAGCIKATSSTAIHCLATGIFPRGGRRTIRLVRQALRMPVVFHWKNEVHESSMSKNLVIVESPAKAKTIKKYLGKDFTVLASYGHVRDLLPKEGAVDPEHDFAMKYQAIEKNEKHLDAIAKAVKNADALFLATDPDREGEAISWHLCEHLKEKKLLKEKTVQRVVFHEITERAILEAMEKPRALSMDLINAQQARRALDYLVGFNLSPLLWKKVRPGLSAGRVQSPALRMIVEREQENEKFVAREYWTIEADLGKSKESFAAKLIQYQGEKLTQFSIDNEPQAHAAEQNLNVAAGGKLLVAKVEKKQRKRNPAPPFTTSTLQQEAARKLGFTAQRTMRIAQQLYEGIDIGGNTVGLITYMRTDSVNLAQEAINEIRELIAARYGADNVPAKPNVYKTKSKNAQEAHEAVRPTVAAQTPDSLKAHLSADQIKLYELVWKRTVACQMIHATIDPVSADLSAGDGNLFRATGSTVVNPGVLVVYEEGVDDSKGDDDNRTLPPLAECDQIRLNQIRPEQHFTEPPPRYTEATLVKALEDHGIGRPSTYASIISTILDRGYVFKKGTELVPSFLAFAGVQLLEQHYGRLVVYDFSARLEDDLDRIAAGDEQRGAWLTRFYQPFKARD